MAFWKSMLSIAVEKENRTLSLACLLCKVSIWSKIMSGYFFLVPDPPLTDTIPVDVRNINLALRPCAKSTKEFAQHLRRASFNWRMQTPLGPSSTAHLQQYLFLTPSTSVKYVEAPQTLPLSSLPEQRLPPP